jgi:hypothetical protein
MTALELEFTHMVNVTCQGHCLNLLIKDLGNVGKRKTTIGEVLQVCKELVGIILDNEKIRAFIHFFQVLVNGKVRTAENSWVLPWLLNQSGGPGFAWFLEIVACSTAVTGLFCLGDGSVVCSHEECPQRPNAWSGGEGNFPKDPLLLVIIIIIYIASYRHLLRCPTCQY